ncbi:MAG: hypothetical protein Q4E75_02355 [bacterium]|nr:hypothetical protein [bacterium]
MNKKTPEEIEKINKMLEGLDEEKKIQELAKIIKEETPKGVLWDKCSEYYQFLEKTESKFKLSILVRDPILAKNFREDLAIENIELISMIIDGLSEKGKLYTINYFLKYFEEKVTYYEDWDRLFPHTRILNIERYLELLETQESKLELAQITNNYDVAKQILSDYPFSEEEKKKYEKLLGKNEDIGKVLRPKILSSKYEFLGKRLDFIVNDPDVADDILSLSDEELELFKILYSKAEINNAEMLNLIFYVPSNIKRFEELTSSILSKLIKGEKICDDVIDKLLWVYTVDRWESDYSGCNIKKSIIYNLDGINDILGLEKIIKEKCDNVIKEESQKDEKNIELIKDALFLSTYGFSFRKAKYLLHGSDPYISEIKLDNQNVQIICMFLAMLQIYNEKDPDKLIDIYNEYTQKNPININYLRSVVFQNKIRILYAQELNSAYADVQDFEKIEEQDGISIYDAGTDFYICMTALAAYQSDFKLPDNYYEYWNNKKILSHINCCSLIANSNLATATIKNICLGFSNLNEDMLINMSNRDCNATEHSTSMYYYDYSHSKYLSPQSLINSTRGEYNEIDYERRDLWYEKNYKKNPDFIVYFEEFDDINNIDNIEQSELEAILEDEQKKWKESIKAAKDFGIPIVKINREKCAKSEIKKIEESFEKYKKMLDETLLSDIITNFENNRTSTQKHSYLREKYFSSERIQMFLDEIYILIQENHDYRSKEANAKELLKLIEQEVKNRNDYLGICGEEELEEFLGFDVSKYKRNILQLIEECKSKENRYR